MVSVAMASGRGARGSSNTHTVDIVPIQVLALYHLTSTNREAFGSAGLEDDWSQI